MKQKLPIFSPQKIIAITQILLLIQAGFWIVTATIHLVESTLIPGNNSNISVFISILSYIDAVIFIITAWGIKNRKKLFAISGTIYLIINLALTITDQFGVSDFVILLINLITLFMLTIILII